MNNANFIESESDIDNIIIKNLLKYKINGFDIHIKSTKSKKDYIIIYFEFSYKGIYKDLCDIEVEKDLFQTFDLYFYKNKYKIINKYYKMLNLI